MSSLLVCAMNSVFGGSKFFLSRSENIFMEHLDNHHAIDIANQLSGHNFCVSQNDKAVSLRDFEKSLPLTA